MALGRESNPDEASPNAEDVALRRAVQKALAQAHIDAADLRVEVNEARVTLFGTVQRAAEKTVLESCAQAVPGVASVTSRLTLVHGS